MLIQFSPLLLVTTVLVAGVMAMAESIPTESHLQFTTISGYFLQDEPTTDPSKFDYVSIPPIDPHLTSDSLCTSRLNQTSA